MREQEISRLLGGEAKFREFGGKVTADKMRTRNRTKRLGGLVCAGLFGTVFALWPSVRALANQILPIQPSTVPANGDLNPYGVAFVPAGFPSGGPAQMGDILVSNFNNSTNVQGTGTTIVAESPNGQTALFFQGTRLGLTTALGVLKAGFVIVGNVPTTNGSNPQAGSLLVLDNKGTIITTFADPTLLDGPWDLTIQDNGGSAIVFVSCVLNGTVTRLNLTVSSNGVMLSQPMTQIAKGYQFASNPAALVVGPTGLAYDASADVLYVASTADNEIFAVQGAAAAKGPHGTGKVIYKDTTHLHGPLGLVLAPNGHLISSQGDAINPDPAHQSEIVEFTNTGNFVTQFSIDSVVGAAFGIAIATADTGAVHFAAVDDATNTLTVFVFSQQ
jgi:hypothetical protein